MNTRIARILSLTATGLVLASCETYKPYTTRPSAPKLKRAAVLVVPDSKEKRRRANDIAEVLEKRGIPCTIVEPGQPVPRDVDGYFTYTSRWAWDLTMYLAEMQIELHDTQTSALVSSARYKQGWIHRYPTPIDVVDNLVGQILGEPIRPPDQPRRKDEQQNRELIRR
jgi:hypothetical protein